VTPDRVTTDGHDSYPRAIRTELGKRVRHRTSAYLNNRLEQGHRGIKGRYRSMRGFKCPRSAAAAFIELLVTGAAAEPAITLGGALGSLRHGLRPTVQASHPRPPRCERRALYPTEPASAKGRGASPDRTPVLAEP
jgi:hypothetical protein